MAKKYLYVEVPAGESGTLKTQLDSSLPDGWIRAIEAEVRGAAMGGSKDFVYYECDAREGRESAMVALMRKGPRTMYVSNVVPLGEANPLTDEQYNRIIDDFRDQVLSSSEYTVTEDDDLVKDDDDDT